MTGSRDAPARDPGLQPERTSLSWTRTSLAVLANGALLFAKDFEHYGGVRWSIGVAACAGVACLVLAIGMRRKRVLARPGDHSAAPRREVYLTGIAVLCLIVMVSVAMFS